MENPTFLNDADVPESTVTPLHIRMLNNLGYTDPSTDDHAQKDQSNVRTVSGSYGACVDGRSKGGKLGDLGNYPELFKSNFRLLFATPHCTLGHS
ncbi:hypothetical protein PoB_007265500 [Plakobranchus ocellatus]|uniref:Uncharacterized protein n=1 Tax=Plakobranchus ocellatus TaxID=259542 RepID=A0AAV4DPT4_9GAST|nr:hypothetical protein PoB_007265500 [Plakobranchus ocellatus]